MWRTSNLQMYIYKLKTFYYKYGFIPNFDTLANLFWLSSKASIFKIFVQIEELGLITKEWKKFVPTKRFHSIPMFESIKAGFPSPANEENKYEIDLQSYLVPNPMETIFLKVKWDSMIDEGILDQDIVIVNKWLKAKMWDIIVAVVDNEYTMKYLMKDEKWKLYLKAANSKYPDIYPEQQLEIFGVVIGSFRKFK